MKTTLSVLTLRAVLALTLGLAGSSVLAQTDDCKNRGQLDTMYCDENKDLVADTPKDAKRWRNPSDTRLHLHPGRGRRRIRDGVQAVSSTHLGKCTAQAVVYFAVQSNAAEIEAMRAGRLHVGGFSTGPTGFAVNLAGADPVRDQRHRERVQGYTSSSSRSARARSRRSPTSRARSSPTRRRRPTRATSRRRCCFRRKASRPTRTTRCCSRAATASRSRVSNPATTTPRRSRPTYSPAWRAAANQGGRLPHHLSQPDFPDLVVRVRARPRTRLAKS